MSQNYVSPTTQPTSSPSADEPNIRQNDDALLTNFSGATPPTLTVAGMHWFDTANKILYVRNADNNNWGLCSNPETSKAISGSVSLDSSYHSMTCLTQSNAVITLPSTGSQVPNYEVEFYVLDDFPVVFQGSGGETFYRDNALVSSVTIPSGNANTLLKLSRYDGNNKWCLSGNLKGVDSDLSTLTNVGKKAILDLIHPIGSIYTTFTNTTPPLNGILGVSWSALAEGYAVMTANTSNTGNASGANRLDTGVTTGHSLTQAELPAASVSVAGSVSGSVAIYARSYLVPTSGVFNENYMISGNSTAISGTFTGSGTVNGSNVAHTHPLNAFNYKLLMYRRIS